MHMKYVYEFMNLCVIEVLIIRGWWKQIEEEKYMCPILHDCVGVIK